jgi:histidinol-phosphate aminotransferase
VAGAKGVPVPLSDGGRLDLGAMAQAVTSKTRVIMVCSPNNPTGPAVRAQEFELFMSSVPPEVLVVLDEAYVEFVTDPAAICSSELLAEHANVVSLRTFSKAYGLAGLRVGYALGRSRIMGAVRAATTPFEVSVIAEMAATLSLQMQDEMRLRVGRIVDQRAAMVEGLRDQGWDVPDAQGNFVWLSLGAEAVPFAEAASKAGVVVRPFAGDGVRISVGEPQGIERALAAARTWV